MTSRTARVTTPPQPEHVPPVGAAPGRRAARPAHGSLDTDRLHLAERLAVRLQGHRRADSATLHAVGLLTASADPARAARLQPRAGEPAPLVLRLGVWALRRAQDEAVLAAGAALDAAMRPEHAGRDRAR